MDKIVELMVRDKNTVIVEKDHTESDNKLSKEYVATLCANLNTLGFYPNAELFNFFSNADANVVVDKYYYTIVSAIKKKVGYQNYRPFYPDFPCQVMEMSDAELFINAIIHYFTDGEYIPAFQNTAKYKNQGLTRRCSAYAAPKECLTELKLGHIEDFENYVRNLMNSKTSISPENYEAIEVAIENLDMADIEIPAFKEIRSFVLSRIMRHKGQLETMKYRYWLEGPTDVLRLITALSDGDVSLATNSKFVSLKRWQRKFIMQTLNSMSDFTEVNKYASKWIRVAERVHPFESNYTVACTMFRTVIEGDKFKSFESKLEVAYKTENLDAVLSLLMQKPGIFARNLDRVIRTFDNIAQSKQILASFEKVAKHVSNPVLLQIMTFFKYRFEYARIETRSFFPKGSAAKAFTTKNNLDITGVLPSVYDDISKVCENAFKSNVSTLKHMGKVYIDPEMKGYNVPFSQRSASRSLSTIARGSRISLKSDAKVIRAFVWWKNSDQRVDLDLSAQLMDENFNLTGHVSYTNLRLGRFGNEYVAVHSGDIVDAPNGACEFIDIDINNMALFSPNTRYIMLQVFNFTKQKFTSLPEAFCGWIVRNECSPKRELYDPRDVQQKFDLTADSSCSIPAVIDLVERKVIWTDMTLNTSKKVLNNLEHNLSGTECLIRAICNTHKASMYDLMKLHAESHGTLADSADEADIIVSLTGDIKPTDFDVIASKYL